ncbi:hypothetical protein D3C85_1649150 [compost metagenome]
MISRILAGENVCLATVAKIARRYVSCDSMSPSVPSNYAVGANQHRLLFTRGILQLQFVQELGLNLNNVVRRFWGRLSRLSYEATNGVIEAGRL